MKDPKQQKKRKRSTERRISFGSIEWSTFAKNDPITPTKNRTAAPIEGGGMRESLDFGFDFNFDVDEDKTRVSGMEDFSVSSICPSEDDFSHSGVSMVEEQRPDAVSKWASKASDLLLWGEYFIFFYFILLFFFFIWYLWWPIELLIII